MIKHHFINNVESSSQQKEWYETIWGLAVITIFLNIISNYIYERGRERLRLSDKSRERLREIDHLEKYHGETERQAEKEVDNEEKVIDNEISI